MTSLRRQLLAIAVATLPWLGSCWCQPPEPERFNTFPTSGPADVTAFCAAWADVQCAYLNRCSPALRAAHGDECPSAMRRTCVTDRAIVVAAHARGRAVYDPIVAGACVDATNARGCGDAVPSSCTTALLGSVSANEPCRHDAECAAGLFCSGGPQTCGLCTERSGAGGPCWAPSSCQTSLTCLNGRCAAPLSAGAPCFMSPVPCAANSVCTGIFPPLSTCTAPVSEGASCATAPCDVGLACVTKDQARLCMRLASDSETCSTAATNAPPCAGEGIRLHCVDGRCAPINVVGTGAACGGQDVCSAANACVSSACQALPRHGEACTPQVGCFGATCVLGVCERPAAPGDSCDDGCRGLECVDGTCGTRACSGGERWDAGPEPDAGRRNRDGG